MKSFLLIAVFLGAGLVALRAANPPPVVEKAPLPSGPLLKRPPAFAKWQITFSYGNNGNGAGNSAASTASPQKPHINGALPRVVTVTQAAPRWEILAVAIDGSQSSCWYDGHAPCLLDQRGNPMYLENASGLSVPRFLMNHGDFPDVEWVSPATYLGTQPGSDYAVFQQAGDDGAIVWIDLPTRFPVRWQKGNETRDFKMLPAPTGPLVFPPAVEKLSKEEAHIRAISSDMPPRGA